MKWKNRKLIWSFRILAMFDVLFLKKFELYKLEGENIVGRTRFDYEEIKNAKL